MSAIAPALKTEPFAAEALRALAFAIAYFAGAELGYSLSLGPSVGGTFWPPAGIALAVFLMTPWRRLPLLLCAGVAANFVSDLLHGQTLPAALGFTLANLGEPLLGAALVRRIRPVGTSFVRLGDVVATVLVTVAVSAPIASALGAYVAERFTENPPGFPAVWQTWWVGDSVGALVLAPCVLQFLSSWRRAVQVPAIAWLEGAAFLAVLAALAEIVFGAPIRSTALPFLLFPVLLWGSVRLGPIGVGVGLCGLVVVAARHSAAGLGPFALDSASLGERLVALQIFVGVMAATFHTLALLWQERSRAVADLRQAHSDLAARHRRIVEQSPLAVVAIEPGGRVKEANPAWRRLVPTAGERRAESRALGEEPALKPFVDRAFDGEIVELPEIAVGVEAQRTLQGFAYPIKDERGHVVEVVLIVRDIAHELEAQRQLLEANRRLREHEDELSRALAQMTEAQRHRDELLAAERFARGEAERASQLKDQFLATLSHELRTPLNAIVGWAHVLLRTVRDPGLTRAAETIERNARAQARLIDDLLDMSRILAGKIGVTLAPVGLGDVVAAAADALRPAAEAKGVTLEVDTSLDLVAMGDAARLQQVVTNLLGNGIKFTHGGGRVAARLSRSGDWAEIVVADTGQGIPEEFVAVVFERFRQADGSITRRHGGLGLGLSIAKHIVEMHGGRIVANSEGLGKGATFTVWLPLAPALGVGDSVADAPSLGETVSLARLRVLVVDDEPDARELLRRLLAEHGCEVATAGSAEGALAALAAGSCDVLLSDIGMPDTDGYALLKRVREQRLPVAVAIAVTAFARGEDRARALEAGFFDHLVKPIDPAKLERVLGAAAREARVRAP